MEYTYLDKNTAEVRQELTEAATAAGYDPAGITLMAAIKSADVEEINYLHRHLGIHEVGENRVQQLLERYDRLDRAGMRIHFIGTLQTNKVKYIIDRVDMIQSLDREALAVEIARRAEAAGRRMPVLVQVNIGRESQKAGIDEEALVPFIEKCAAMPGLQVEGLMAIMPFVDDPETIRPLFRRMRGWFERLRDADMANVNMNVLSMGMSGDCLVAAEEGATMVRIGRGIFGARNYNI